MLSRSYYRDSEVLRSMRSGSDVDSVGTWALYRVRSVVHHSTASHSLSRRLTFRRSRGDHTHKLRLSIMENLQVRRYDMIDEICK